MPLQKEIKSRSMSDIELAESDIATATEIKFREALTTLGEPNSVQEMILTPSRVTSLPIVLPRDNMRGILEDNAGKVSLIPSVRVAHHIGDLNAPTKGGIRVVRLPPNLPKSKELEYITSISTALSREALAKVGIIGFPELCKFFGIDPKQIFAGGAKGVIGVPSEIYDQAKESGNLKKLVRDLAMSYGYSYGLRGAIGGRIDSVASDMDTQDPDAMDALLLGYKSATEELNLGIPDNELSAVVTHKSLEFGGTASREGAMGASASIAINMALENHGLNVEGQRVVIDGSGNAAITTAKELQKLGAVIVGISDTSGHFYSESGFDIKDIEKYKKEGINIQSISQKLTGTFFTLAEKDKFLGSNHDVLVIASTENIITEKNVAVIKPTSRIVAEISNSGITPNAQKILYDRDINCLPGIVTGIGGMTSSWVEWLGNINKHSYSLEAGNRVIVRALNNIIPLMFQEAEERKISWTDAAYIIAARRSVEMFTNHAMRNRIPHVSDRTPVDVFEGKEEIEKTENDLPAKFLSTHKKNLQNLLESAEKFSFADYEKALKMHIDTLLKNRLPGRTFTILSAMDADSLATFLLMRKMYADVPISLVYPRFHNDIDSEREGRRRQFIDKYNIPVFSINDAVSLEASRSELPKVVLYEFWADEVIEAFSKSTGLNKSIFKEDRGLLFNNSLGTLINNYWKLVANMTHGVMIGSLNATSLKLGDYYRMALDGEVYPLASLFRTDVDKMLKDYFHAPARLRSVSPWHMRVRLRRDLEQTIQWAAINKQVTDKDVYLLPRNFYRIADLILLLKYDYEKNWNEIDELIVNGLTNNKSTEIMPIEKEIIEWAIDEVRMLTHFAEEKNRLEEHRFFNFPRK